RLLFSLFFFFTAPATPQIYPLSLHDALPISRHRFLQSRAGAADDLRHVGPAWPGQTRARPRSVAPAGCAGFRRQFQRRGGPPWRSEEHTSELQSQSNLVCRLLLEKKKKTERY